MLARSKPIFYLFPFPSLAVALHRELLARVAERAAADAFAHCSPDNAQLLVVFLLHCADLCNPLLCAAAGTKVFSRPPRIRPNPLRC